MYAVARCRVGAARASFFPFPIMLGFSMFTKASVVSTGAVCRIVAVFLLCAIVAAAASPDNDGRIRPYTENPFYWQYKGQPVLLIGGSWQDNLFNHPTRLAEHLDTLAAVGGNFVRNTMSTREQGNLWPCAEVEEGVYDLDQWNEAYWERFDNFGSSGIGILLNVKKVMWHQEVFAVNLRGRCSHDLGRTVSRFWVGVLPHGAHVV